MARLPEFDQGPQAAAQANIGAVPFASSEGLFAIGKAVGAVGTAANNFFIRRENEKNKESALKISDDIRETWTQENMRLASRAPKDGFVSRSEGRPRLAENGELIQEGEGEDFKEPKTYTKYVKDRFFEDVESRIVGQSEDVQEAIRAGAQNLWINKFNKFHSGTEFRQVKKTNANEFSERFDRTSNTMRRLPPKAEFDEQGYAPQEILDVSISSGERRIDSDTTLTDQEKDIRKKIMKEGLAESYVRRRLETDPEFIQEQLLSGKLDKYLDQKQLNVFIPMAERGASQADRDRISGLQSDLKKRMEGQLAEIQNTGSSIAPEITKEDFEEVHKDKDSLEDNWRRFNLNVQKANIDHSVKEVFSQLDFVEASAVVGQQIQIVDAAEGDDAIVEGYRLQQMHRAISQVSALRKNDPAQIGRQGTAFKSVSESNMTEGQKKRTLDNISVRSQVSNGVSLDNINILTKTEAESLSGVISSAINFADDGAVKAEQAFNEAVAQHPEQGDKIMRQLVRDFKVDPRFEVLMGLDDPTSRQQVRRLIDQFKKVSELKEAIGNDAVKAVDDKIAELMRNFNSSTSGQGSAQTGRNLGTKVSETMRQIAYLGVLDNQTLSGEDSAQQAYDQAIDSQYKFIEWNEGQSIRIPSVLKGKDFLGNPVFVQNPHGSTVIGRGLNDWLNGINVDNVQTISSPGQQLSEEEEKKILRNSFADRRTAQDRDELFSGRRSAVIDSNFGTVGSAFDNVFGADLKDRPNLVVRLSSDESRMEVWIKTHTGVIQPVKLKNGETLGESLLLLKSIGDAALYSEKAHPDESILTRKFTFSETIEDQIRKSKKEIDKAQGFQPAFTGSSLDAREISDIHNPGSTSGLADDITLREIKAAIRKSRNNEKK